MHNVGRSDAPAEVLIRAHRAGVVLSALPFTMLVSLVLAGFLASTHWGVVESRVLLFWLGVVSLVNLARIVLALAYRKIMPQPEHSLPWERLSLFGALLAGVAWGAGAYLLFVEQSVAHQAMLAFVIAGLCAGAVATMSAHILSVAGFIVLATLPLLYRFAGSAQELATPMTVMLALFILMLLPTSARFYGNLNDMLRERYVRQCLQRRETARSAVLELVASGAPLKQVLERVVREAEEERPASRVGILLLDDGGRCLRVGAAPSLPEEYRQALDDLRPGADMGPCGVAAFEKRRFIAEDLSGHPDWVSGRQAVMHFGLAACWSEPVVATDGSVLGVLAVFHAQPHKPDEEELEWVENMSRLASIAIERGRASETTRLAALVYQNSSEAMIVTDARGRVLAVNAAFSEHTGWTSEAIIGSLAEALVFDVGNDQAAKALRSAVLANGRWQGELECRRLDGGAFPAWVTIDSIGGDDGRVSRRVILLSDMTEKKEADALIWSQANYDSLTGMPNRRLFVDRLLHAIKSARRDRHQVAVFVVDLDRFKAVNETLGHRHGDILLVEAARRLRACLRDSDTVARLAADEFAIAMGELPSVTVIGRICEEIISSFNRPFKLGDEEVFVSASIGISVFPDDATDAEALLGHAEQAMYAAKQGGRNRFSFFTRGMQEAALHRARMLKDLRHAVSHNQFSLHYQPIVDLADGRIRKAEALLRWQRPCGDMVDPAQFVPLAEESGLIHEIGAWVFREATERLRIWRARYDHRFQVSINKSPLELLAATREGMDVVEQLALSGLAGEGVAIEITEGVLVDPASNINDTLLRLRDAGVQVAIDDFGTGYSSLAYLKRFDIDYLKIDKSFIRNLEADASDLVLAEAIIVMAHKLGFKVIAEGVESEAQRDILCQIGCDYAQGYLFSRPVPADDFDLLLQRESALSGARLTTIEGGLAKRRQGGGS